MNIVVTSDPHSGIDVMLGGYNSQKQQYYSNKIENLLSNMAGYDPSIMAYYKETVDNIKSIANQYFSQDAINKVQNLLSQVNNVLNNDCIYFVDKFAYRANINPVMQEFIMSHPKISTMYYKNQVDGFSDTYENPEPDIYGENRYAYKRVMDGVLRDDNTYCTYLDIEDDDELTVAEQCTVLKSWDHVDIALLHQQDPTDLYSYDYEIFKETIVSDQLDKANEKEKNEEDEE